MAMMKRWAVLLLAFGLLAAACAADTTDTEAPAATDAPMATDAPVEAAGDLAACPNPLVIQTDWFPESEHGALYQLTKGAGSVDPESGVFQGPLAYGDTDLTIEIRAGGPYIGFQPDITLLYSDDSIFLGYSNSDEQIALFETQPTIAVVAPLDKNPQMIMFDPETYDWDSWDDVKGSGAILNIFAGGYWGDYLVGAGFVDADQIDPSYDGSPVRFITADGAIAQQGFATQEPYNYQYDFEDWGRPVDYLLLHDSGWETYPQALVIRADKLDDAAKECLAAFVPIIQQAAVDFMVDPGPVNAAIHQAVIDLDSFWVLSEDGMVNTVKLMDELGIVSNGPNDTLGDFILERIDGQIELARASGFDIPADLKASDLATNEFIDYSIGR